MKINYSYELLNRFFHHGHYKYREILSGPTQPSAPEKIQHRKGIEQEKKSGEDAVRCRLGIFHLLDSALCDQYGILNLPPETCWGIPNCQGPWQIFFQISGRTVRTFGYLWHDRLQGNHILPTLGILIKLLQPDHILLHELELPQGVPQPLRMS